MARSNTYTTYPTFIDYLMSFSGDSNDTYNGLAAYLVYDKDNLDGSDNSSAFTVERMCNKYNLKNRTYDYPISCLSGYITDFAEPIYFICSLSAYPFTSDTYESALNEAASAKLEESPIYDYLIRRSELENKFNTKNSSSYWPDNVSWSSGYEENEYTKYSIPETTLNSSATVVLSSSGDYAVSASGLNVVNGCLIGLIGSENFTPIGYISIDAVRAGTNFTFSPDARGILGIS